MGKNDKPKAAKKPQAEPKKAAKKVFIADPSAEKHSHKKFDKFKKGNK